MSDVFDTADPTPGYRYDTERGRWVPDVPAAVPSAQLEPELRWTPDVPETCEDRQYVCCDMLTPDEHTRSYGYPQAGYTGEVSEDALKLYLGEVSQPNPYAVGSVFRTSWGYDQTNVEFYVVVRETAASVWLARCVDVVIDGRLYPDEDHVDGTSTMHRKGKHGTYVRMDDVRYAYPYNSGGCYDTYAAGGAGH